MENAERIARKYLHQAEQEYGYAHPTVARRLTELAMVLEQNGDLETALLLQERALHIDEQTFGHSSPLIESRLNSMAALMVRLGQYEEADAIRDQVNLLSG